jgi:tRNA nucleotidyltransferase (CCA-adding enzyme)
VTVEELLNDVLREIKPSSEDELKVREISEKITDALKSEARALGLNVEVEIYGSVAKGTWLKGDVDLDVFLMADMDVPKEKLISDGLESARKVFKSFGGRWVERYADHPYVEGWIDGVRVDVVPCYRVKPGEWLTAVDRTPYHTKYIKSKLASEALDQVRLLKKFTKGVGVYGADIKTGGFSGYLCELLIVNYGSFIKTLEATSKWGRRAIIDVNKYYSGRLGDLKKKFQHPLIVVDPVDPNRNVAAAVRLETLCNFIIASKCFLKKPSKVFFNPPNPMKLTETAFKEKLESRGLDLVAVSFGAIEAVPDVLWGQLYRTLDSLKALLENWGFKVYRARAWTDERELTVFMFELESSILSRLKVHMGPPVFSRELWSFLDKHLRRGKTSTGPWIEGDRLIIEVERRFRDLKDLFDFFFKVDGGVSVGVRGRVAEAIGRGFKVLRNMELWNLMGSNVDFNMFVSEFLDGLPMWLKAWLEEAEFDKTRNVEARQPTDV